jgi:hypothetical protein
MLCSNIKNKSKMTSVYHEYSNFVTNNKKQIELSKSCVCLQCKETFLSTQIILYIYSNSTGICPYCQSDLIVPDYFEIDDKQNKINKWHKCIVDDSVNISENIEFYNDNHINKKRKT